MIIDYSLLTIDLYDLFDFYDFYDLFDQFDFDMKLKLIIKLITVFLLATISAEAQHKKKQKTDTLTVYREFAKLGQWYLGVPLQINLRMVHRTVPVIAQEDSAQTDMILYYGKNDFYMMAEGMEQIANDTLIVMVNNEVKMIRLYPNDGQLIKSLEKMVSVLMPDSAIEKLVQRYSAKMQNDEKGMKRITLQSRDKISGTDLFKETIHIVYHSGTYQPVSYQQSKMSLLPVDSVAYDQLANDTAYIGRLISADTHEGKLFFLIKEKITQYMFTKITREMRTPPAREQDRVIRRANGEYQAAKGFEEYLVSSEW